MAGAGVLRCCRNHILESGCYFLGRFAAVESPEGVYSIDTTRQLIVYGALFAAVLLVGGLVFFRNMSRKEIFWSATIIVLYGLVLTAVEGFADISAEQSLLIYELSRPFEWCQFWSSGLYLLTGNIWIGAIASKLSIYLLVLFGKGK